MLERCSDVSMYILADKFPIIFVWNPIKFHVFIAIHQIDWLFKSKTDVLSPLCRLLRHPCTDTNMYTMYIYIYILCNELVGKKRYFSTAPITNFSFLLNLLSIDVDFIYILYICMYCVFYPFLLSI